MSTALAPKEVQSWLTTGDQKSLLAPQPRKTLRPAADRGGDTLLLAIDPQTTYQRMDGFGAALTDSSAWLLMKSMSPQTRQRTLESLFSPREGIGMSVLRLPMGASDFSSKGSYTYNDLPAGQTDPTLKRFSIACDLDYTIPLLRQIRKINPALKIIASPWSAPAWMKTGRKLNGGWLEWSAHSAYALYFVKFVRAYAEHGVPIWALTVQNEPRLERDSYPTMRMEPGDQARFIRDHLGPALEKARLRTKIFCWDHNWDAPEYPIEVLKDPAARRYIAGSAFHGYAGDVSAQEKVCQAYPDKEIHFTESSGGDWAKNFGGNLQWDLKNLLIGAPRYFARSVLKWNLVLDERHGPQNGGCTDCRGIVTYHQGSGEVVNSSEYYAFGHASKFVRPGAYRIGSPDLRDLPNVAYRNPDGSRVLLLCNTSGERQSALVRCEKKEFDLSLQPGAALTLRW